MSRFSQAISEGDGISVIPVLEADVAAFAVLAEAAGAEALAVAAGDVGRAREATALPIVARSLDPRGLSAAGADACIVGLDGLGGRDEELEGVHALARELGLDCAIDVRDEDELVSVLERVDPDIVLISEREPDRGDDALERTLDLLADVPVGKLVVSEARIVSREQVVALERAGVDAVLVHGLARGGSDFSTLLEDLVGGSGAHH
jgi:indole-3-glycerol phosphate synthase